jgi:hypothetical protein
LISSCSKIAAIQIKIPKIRWDQKESLVKLKALENAFNRDFNSRLNHSPSYIDSTGSSLGFKALSIFTKPSSGSMDGTGTASLHGCKTAVDPESLRQIARQMAMDGEDPLKTLDE